MQNQLSADSASNSIVKTNETAKSKIILLSNESEEQIPSDLPIVTGKHDESDISARSVLGSSERAESLYEKHAVSSSSFTEESKQGFLNVNVKPWAEVEVDGAKVGTTPIRKLKLKAGTRRIRLENAPLNFVEEIVVNLKTGKSAVINREISK